MARRNHLVEGLSGMGQSAVFDELVRRGFSALSTDRVWSFHADPVTGLPTAAAGHATWMWDEHLARSALEPSDGEWAQSPRSWTARTAA